jgi:hypothetical protein
MLHFYNLANGTLQFLFGVFEVYREMLGAFLENEELMVLGKGLLVYYI